MSNPNTSQDWVHPYMLATIDKVAFVPFNCALYEQLIYVLGQAFVRIKIETPKFRKVFLISGRQ